VQAESIAMIRGGYGDSKHGFGIVGLNGVTANGNTTIDSYDPSITPYTSKSNGSVASNDVINFVGNTTVDGDVRPSPDPSDMLKTSSNSTVTGWEAPLDEHLSYATPTAPSSNNNDQLPANWLNGHNDFNPPSGTYTLTGGTAASPVVFHVNDFNMTG